MTATTYKQIAEETGLNPQTATRFIKYMQTRWPEDETQKCADGYAREWAARFANGYEWAASDLHGQALLANMEG